MQDAAWLHTLDPFAVQFTSSFGVRWYGIAYVAGVLVGWWLLRLCSKRSLTPLSMDEIGDGMLALVIGVFVGGRLGYAIIYQPSLFVQFSTSPPFWGLLAINQGGMASHGGMVGVILAGLWIARRTKVSKLHLMDLVALAAPPGLCFGRLTNFINGELFGKIVAMPGEPGPWWSVRFPHELVTRHAPPLTSQQTDQLVSLLDRAQAGWDAADGAGAEAAIHRLITLVQRGVDDYGRELAPLLAARHPSQLYQAASEGLILFAALWIIWLKPRKPGVVGAWFLILYGLLRTLTEHWRLPDDHLLTPRIYGLSRGQWLSVLMVIVGGIALGIVRKRHAAVMGGWGRPARPATAEAS